MQASTEPSAQQSGQPSSLKNSHSSPTVNPLQRRGALPASVLPASAPASLPPLPPLAALNGALAIRWPLESTQ
jgi:hypothetical protein